MRICFLSSTVFIFDKRIWNQCSSKCWEKGIKHWQLIIINTQEIKKYTMKITRFCYLFYIFSLSRSFCSIFFCLIVIVTIKVDFSRRDCIYENTVWVFRYVRFIFKINSTQYFFFCLICMVRNLASPTIKRYGRCSHFQSHFRNRNLSNGALASQDVNQSLMCIDDRCGLGPNLIL